MSYNGWSNFATWKANLELVDGLNPAEFLADQLLDMTEDADEATDRLAEWLAEMADEIVTAEATGWALSLAQDFLADVDWVEIAEHCVTDYMAELV